MLIRSVSSGGEPAGGARLRVISLNCAGGDPQALAEVAAYHPDVVLLQESPPAAKIPELARRLFGAEASWLTALDPAILVRGNLEGIPLPRDIRMSFVRGRARLASGPEIEVVSLRLTPAIFRMDLWSPDCWRSQAENRRARRAMLRNLTGLLPSIPLETPVIVGGDFNAPQGDAVFSLLSPRLHDAFLEGGSGWPNTITNELPLLRIDQIWVSRHFWCRRAAVYRTIHSDHRMVVCDLEWKGSNGGSQEEGLHGRSVAAGRVSQADSGGG